MDSHLVQSVDTIILILLFNTECGHSHCSHLVQHVDSHINLVQSVDIVISSVPYIILSGNRHIQK